MKATYRQDMNRNYLIMEEETPYREDYRMRMVLSNHIPGLLPCSVRGIDACSRFYYDISGRQSLKGYLEQNGLQTDLLKRLIGALLLVESACLDYLLSMRNVILRTEYIYLECEDFLFCYLPLWDEDTGEGVHTLLESLLQVVDPDDRITARLLYKLYNGTYGEFNLRSLVQDETAGFGENAGRSFKKTYGESCGEGYENEWADDGCFIRDETEPHGVESYGAEPYGADERQDVYLNADTRTALKEEGAEKEALPKSKLILSVCALVILVALLVSGRAGEPLVRILIGTVISTLFILGLVSLCKKKKNAMRRHAKSLKTQRMKSREPVPESFFDEEEDDFEEDPATIILRTDASDPLLLISADGREQITVDTSPYYVGSKEGSVSNAILNPAVSRFHAKIERLTGSWFLEDLNSTNGTFHNRKRITQGERIELSDGDRVSFAKSVYHVMIREKEGEFTS